MHESAYEEICLLLDAMEMTDNDSRKEVLKDMIKEIAHDQVEIKKLAYPRAE